MFPSLSDERSIFFNWFKSTKSIVFVILFFFDFYIFKIVYLNIILNIFYIIFNTALKTETKRPGVLMKGWFKYIVVRPSNDNQTFEVNHDFGIESPK